MEVMSDQSLSGSEIKLSPRTIRSQVIAQCTPLRPSSAVSGWWARAFAQPSWPFNYGRAVCMIRDDVGKMVAETRNKLVQFCLDKENDSFEIAYVAWQDDDVLPISSLVWRALLDHCVKDGFDISSGVYFSREKHFPQPLIFPEKGHGVTPFDPDKGWKNVWGCGMGLTLVKMDVYRKMLQEGLPKDCFGNPEWYRTPGRDEDVRIVDGCMEHGGTEDLYFCDRAGLLGFKICVDMGKFCFGFHLDEDNYNVAYPLEQWAQYCKNQPIVWPTSDGQVAWS